MILLKLLAWLTVIAVTVCAALPIRYRAKQRHEKIWTVLNKRMIATLSVEAAMMVITLIAASLASVEAGSNTPNAIVEVYASVPAPPPVFVSKLTEATDTIKDLQSRLDKAEEQNAQLESSLGDFESLENMYAMTLVPLGDFTLTGYDDCVICCEDYALNRPKVNGRKVIETASGEWGTVGVTVAVDTSVIPWGSYLFIEGYGVRRAQDVGGAIKGHHVDLFMSSHEEAKAIGNQTVKVWLLSDGSGN